MTSNDPDSTTKATVIVATYRGAERMALVLAALSRQTLPERDFEVLIVDDGSPGGFTLADFPRHATVIALDRNGGPGAARNAGVARATAPIVVFLDDDCLPDPNWLREILAGFSKAEIMGVAGLPEPQQEDGSRLALAFQQAKNPWQPGSARIAKSSNRVYRLGHYLRAQLVDTGPTSGQPLFAASAGNLAFRREMFVAAGGFRSEMRTGEDVELCVRMRARYPKHHIAYRPEARAVHRIDGSLCTLIRRYHVWGMGLPELGRIIGAPPVVYPFPIALTALLLMSQARRERLLLVAALPLAIYPRWAIKAAIEQKPEALLFGYLQLLIESASNLGLAEGLLHRMSGGRPDRKRSATLRRYGG